jgi:hypothetical protein
MFSLDSKTFFLAYVIISTVAIIIYAILKCYFNITVFDKYVYLETDTDAKKDDSKYMNDLIKYLISHVLSFFIFGLIFTISNAKEMIFKIVLFELLLIIIRYCNISKAFTLHNMKDLSFTIIVDTVSYLFGCLCIYYFYLLKTNKMFIMR